ncbi:hypothetical protein HDE_07837 [Halotydeus destructor]|nr:hypothetical protein HDE_07837 [Halotydeus destructor]
MKERFHSDVFKFRGRITLTDLSFLPTKLWRSNALGRIFYDISTIPVRGLNWTEIYTESLTTGFYDEQKQYSGFLGLIQHNLTDYAFQVVRTDAIVEDSIYVGPAIYSGSSYIVSKTEMFNYENDVQITQVVKHFNKIAWLYLAIICSLITISCICMYIVLSNDELTPRKVAHISKKPIWRWLEILSCQQSISFDTASTSITWLATSFGCFVIVSGYLLSFMSCDQVAKQPRPYIDTLEALLSAEFRIPPTAFTNFFVYQELMDPKNGSKMYHLAELIKEKNGFVNAEKTMKDFGQTSKLMFDLIGSIDRAEKTLVLESLFWNLLWFRLFCGLDSVKASEMIVSEPFNEGVLTYFFNKRLPADVIRYMEYHGRNAAEFSLAAEAMKSLADYVISALLNSNFKTLRCFKKLKDNELFDLKYDDTTLEPYRSTFQSFIWALCFSTLVLIAGQLIYLHASSTERKLFTRRKVRKRDPSTFHASKLRVYCRHLQLRIVSSDELIRHLKTTTE